MRNLRAILHRDPPLHNRRRTDPGFEPVTELTEEQRRKLGKLTGRHRRTYIIDLEIAAAGDHLHRLRREDDLDI